MPAPTQPPPCNLESFVISCSQFFFDLIISSFLYSLVEVKSSSIKVVMRNCSSIPENLFQCIWLEKHSRISQLISVLSASNSLILITVWNCVTYVISMIYWFFFFVSFESKKDKHLKSLLDRFTTLKTPGYFKSQSLWKK